MVFCGRSKQELHTSSETESFKHFFLRFSFVTCDFLIGALKVTRERSVNYKILLNDLEGVQCFLLGRFRPRRNAS